MVNLRGLAWIGEAVVSSSSGGQSSYEVWVEGEKGKDACRDGISKNRSGLQKTIVLGYGSTVTTSVLSTMGLACSNLLIWYSQQLPRLNRGEKRQQSRLATWKDSGDRED